MFVLDVNVLIYAHRTDSCDDHAAYAEWLTKVATGSPGSMVTPSSGSCGISTGAGAFAPPTR